MATPFEIENARLRIALECTVIRLKTFTPGIGDHYTRAEVIEHIEAALAALSGSAPTGTPNE